MAEQKTAYVHKDGVAQVSELGVGGTTPAATQTAIADLGSAPTAADHNAVLAVLRTFGLIET